ncbi:Pro-apoptotic serine protease NMA111 [Erysiphe neolycopersici]|uniref:Pro-apoptotic serine protease NMA111 n=1 Tax=Erysiphe neolycopersici TaxID=212602 RepID=A0A420HBQ9_9PEZI|nr:Pro-apoptotic serine protease NMA111 [Erysiphe neolycopersici]
MKHWLQISLRLRSSISLLWSSARVQILSPFPFVQRVNLGKTYSLTYPFSTVLSLHNMNGLSSPKKRKQYPGSAIERPQKQHKLFTGMDSNQSNILSDEDLEIEVEETRIVPGVADTAEWQACIEKVVRNVVSIRFCQTCSFDSDSALTSEATGFVVDAERGYIMTNRHVVGAGPFWGFCIFDNHEEVDAYPVYRDPVHDFGILRFNPKAIKYMPVTSLTLRPDLAKVGSEIRVVGNDAGEKLSILSGVISRLDRNAPEYGEGYCDFNTNYIQAAASASGGSSGSPVVNIDGYAVALQAGGRSDGAATDYFLPLDRPLRALRCIQEDKPITRGTIQCQWMIKPFDECRRLGLTMLWESAIRKNFPKETGMLVAEIVLPEGPSDHKVEEGDVLVKVNGELLTQFIRLDDILDSSVGGQVKLLLQRGGEDIEVEVEVGDLHSITPDRFVSVSGGSFHNLSYQQARLYAVACKGVYICEATGSFRFEHMDSGWIIQTVDHKKTPDLDSFIEVMKKIPDRARVVVTYKHLRDLHTLNTSILTIDRHWCQKMRLAVRNDTTGLWDFTDLDDALPATPPIPRSASFIQLSNTQHTAAADIVRSFVRVLCNMPMKLDGFPRNRKWGMGVVIDAEKGLVVVSRAIIPYDLCDITITIADSIIVEGKVVFMHPLQNYAVIKYDPSLVDAPVQSAKLSTTHITQGASTYFVGFNQNMRIVIAQTTVTDITAVAIPANTLAPRYRAVNVDAITVDTSLSGQCGSGVLVGEDGTVQALWLTYLGERSPSTQKDTDYHLGLATPCLLPVIRKIQAGERPHLRMLSVEFNAIQMSQARIMGVSEKWIKKVAEDNQSRHQLFMVRKRTFERGDDKATLLEGDVVLTLNGKIITRVSELDVMYDHEVLDAVILRDCVEISIKLPTVSADDLETDRAVNFCGAVLHRPHHAVRQQISKLHSEVYVSARTRGSPAYQYGLTPTNFVTHVNGQPTKDIEDFLKVVVPIPDNTYFRVRAMTFDNVPWVITMKKNDHYFPTTEWIKDPSELSAWRRVTYENGQPVLGEGSEGISAVAAESFNSDE